jgi:Beta-lactamase class C and other penicillin binding proteins
MNSGHGTDPTGNTRSRDGDWVRGFMEWPLQYEPGSCYCYNSLGTYVLSAAVQKVTGQKVVDYLDSRLWKPLGIKKALLAGESVRRQHRGMGPLPEDGRPRQDGPLPPERG